jgi:hypothetical protein
VHDANHAQHPPVAVQRRQRLRLKRLLLLPHGNVREMDGRLKCG